MMTVNDRVVSGRGKDGGLICRLAGRLARFRDDDSGAMIILGFMLLVLMLMVGGMAVDLMRFETTRTRLQSTADRSSLAAASLSQSRDCEEVIEDYFYKEGIPEYLKSTDCQDAFNYSSASAEVEAEVPSFFMQMIGIETLSAVADSTAEERVTDVEISMVLDVSGSMANNNRLVNLKVAAKDFIDTVMAGDDEQKISVSLIPYNAQVNLGATLMARYNVTAPHTLSHCVDFAASNFSGTALSNTVSLPRTGHIDPFSGSDDPSVSGSWHCSTETRNIVRPFLRNVTTLKNAIDGLQSGGNTSIDVGMKWGAALLDPGSQPVVTGMITAGAVPSNFSGRPFAFNREDTLKVVVIMSDGDNTDQFVMNPTYITGNSNVWRNSSTGQVTVQHTSRSPQYYTLTQTQINNDQAGAWVNSIPSGSTRLTYTGLWQQYPINWVAWNLYAYPLGTNNSTRNALYTTWTGNFRTVNNLATKNTRLTSICNATKAAGIRVFTIGFAAPTNGATQLRNCATIPGDYFYVDDSNDIDIGVAFNSIARQISALRLTQ